MKNLQQTRMQSAIELLAYKALKQMAETKSTCTLDEDDVNEIMLVAGAPMLTPETLKDKPLEVIL